MIPAPFEYARADSVEHAVELLGSDEEAKLLAGGQSLIPLMRLRFARPTILVDVGCLSNLAYVRANGDGIAIGALTRHAQLVADPALRNGAALVARGASLVGDPQVRHRGTIGGSIAHGDPASDLAAIVLTLDGELVVHGPEGERVLRPRAFFRGPFETALGPRDVLTELRVPKVDAGVYLKHQRRAHDWATVGVVAARVDGAVRVGLASMGGTPLRARAVEQAVADGASAVEAAAHAADDTDPPSDVNGSADYRAHLAQVLVRRALEQL